MRTPAPRGGQFCIGRLYPCFRWTKYPDTVLLHGIAERRRTHRRVSQIVLKGRLDVQWQGGALQAQRLSMLDVLPIGVFGFAGTCIQEDLADKAKKARYPRPQVRQGRGGISASYFRPGARRSRWQQRLPSDMAAACAGLTSPKDLSRCGWLRTSLSEILELFRYLPEKTTVLVVRSLRG